MIGPLMGTVRPFTVNPKNTLVFTTATEHPGFQVSSLTTGKVLYSESFGAFPAGFPISGPSHGITLSPDEKTLYVIDAVHREVRVWNVAGVAEGIAPKQLGVVPVEGLSGEESLCAYDCGRGGWLQPRSAAKAPIRSGRKLFNRPSLSRGRRTLSGAFR